MSLADYLQDDRWIVLRKDGVEFAGARGEYISFGKMLPEGI